MLLRVTHSGAPDEAKASASKCTLGNSPLVVLASLLLLLPVSARAARGVALGAPNDSLGARAVDAVGPPAARSLATLGDPALDYTLNCQGCHRADGSATPGAVPALRGSVARLLAVGGGREYLARVPGVAQSTLDDEALAALLNWMLEFFDAEHMPGDFRPYTAAEIRELRRSPLLEPLRVRAQLLGFIE